MASTAATVKAVTRSDDLEKIGTGLSSYVSIRGAAHSALETLTQSRKHRRARLFAKNEAEFRLR
jgi:hypothetical protein